jgi:hypothetical protein
MWKLIIFFSKHQYATLDAIYWLKCYTNCYQWADIFGYGGISGSTPRQSSRPVACKGLVTEGVVEMVET